MVKKQTLKKKHKKVKAKLEKTALSATKWIGSIESLILHTVVFVSAFSLVLFGVSFERVLLVLTTVLSLEAIYLAIFIQMSVNQNTAQLAQVEADIDEIQEDVEEIAEDVEEIAEDVEDIAEDVEGIQEDVEEIEKDVESMEKDINEIHKDVEEMQETVEEIAEDEHKK